MEDSKKFEQLENEIKKFKKSYLETNLTTIFFNSLIRMILLHLSNMDKNFVEVAPTYIRLSTEGITDYINKSCPKESKEFCNNFVNGLCKEYLQLIEDINKAKQSETKENSPS